jgi:hypothetical protein
VSNSKLQKELVERLQAICDDLGLILGIPAGNEVGVLIGTQTFIESVADIVGQEEYTLEEDYEDALEEALLSLPKGKSNNDDPSFH